MKGDAISALTTPTSHCLHADQLTCFQLPISYTPFTLALGVNQVGEAQAREEAAGNFRTEEMITGDEGEIRTEERKEICSGATLMATHAYTRNPESPIGKEIDLQQWETLVFKGLHAENEHWRLV